MDAQKIQGQLDRDMRTMAARCEWLVRRMVETTNTIALLRGVRMLRSSMSCEHHRSDFGGPFFSSRLTAAGHFVLLCDEAQRLSKHAMEWLRDVYASSRTGVCAC
jgi:hypothetical protein